MINTKSAKPMGQGIPTEYHLTLKDAVQHDILTYLTESLGEQSEHALIVGGLGGGRFASSDEYDEELASQIENISELFLGRQWFNPKGM